MNHTVQSLQQALKNQVRRLQKQSSKLDRQSQRLSLFRLAAFVGGLALIYLAGSYGPEWSFWLVIIAFLAGFYQLITLHRRLEQTSKKFSVWKEIRQKHLSRQSLQWDDLPYRKPGNLSQNHPFAQDLDIIGQQSLLQLIDSGNYQGSTDRLTELLLTEQPNPQDIAGRQKIIKELAALPTFRDKLHLMARLHQKKKLDSDWSLEELREHLNQAKEVNHSGTLLVLGSLATANIVLAILYFTGLVPPYVLFSLVAYLVYYNFNSGKSEGLFEESSQIKKQLSRFNAVLRYLENYHYRSGSNLEDFCSIYWSQDESPSQYIHTIIRISSAASAQQSDVIWMLLNLIVPWDLYFTQKLSTYKQELGPRLSQWMDQFYELEALSSLANFKWLNPDYTFSLPEEEHTKYALCAKKMGHQIIPRDEKVANDLTISEKGELLLITGSNMDGKSTFLRTIGINLALCFSGGPVDAEAFSTLPFRLYSSINVSDSLNNGLSHFYAEVKQLHGLLNMLEDRHPMPVFFLVDEIYRGTNNRERLQGSRAFLQKVANKNGVGLVSTHDLELAQLE